MPPRFRLVAVAVGACFFATGAAGLTYEIVWNRQLALLMGNTSYSLATLLTVFMGGLALGSWVGGRWVPAGRRALIAYGLLEIGVGLCGLVLPFVFGLTRPLFAFAYQHYGSFVLFNLVQASVVGFMLLVPTAMMGATLPILTHFLAARVAALGRTVGVLYAINSGGAFAGAMFCGLLLLPQLGIRSTTYVAVAINLVVGLVTLTIGLMLPAGAEAGEPEPEAQPRSARRRKSESDEAVPYLNTTVLLVGYAVSGCVAMVFQVAWTRAVTVTIGSSTYAFTLIAGAFILGLALGSIVLGWIGDRRIGRYAVGILPAVIGLSALVTVARLGVLPIDISRLFVASESFAQLEWAKFRTIFFIFLLPTFCMGGLLPIVSRQVAHQRDEAGRSVGNAYAANAVGTILGSFLGGFVLVPWVGMRHSIMIGAGTSLAVGAVFLWHAARTMTLRMAFVGALAVVSLLAYLTTPDWDPSVMASGPFVSPERYAAGAQDSDAAIRQRMRSRILYYEEGVSTLVTVLEAANGSLSLVVGGKPDAFSYATTQNWLGHLPMLLRPDAERVLVVGLGSGHTLGSVERHPNVREIDCVELSPEVVTAARRFFSPYTGNALDDPRVRTIVGDGRLHLEYTQSTYDVIVSQPSNPWIAGAASMFTRECFTAMRGRLNEGGLACIWFQGFKMPTENFKVLCQTWADVWEHSAIWTSRVKGEYLLTGATRPLAIDFAALHERYELPDVNEQMQGILMPTPAHMLGYLATTDAGLAELSAGASVNTDDNARIEFDTPRAMWRDHTDEILSLVHTQRVDPWSFVSGDDQDSTYVDNHRLGAQILADQYEILRARALPTAERMRILDDVLGRNPYDATARRDKRSLTPR